MTRVCGLCVISGKPGGVLSTAIEENFREKLKKLDYLNALRFL